MLNKEKIKFLRKALKALPSETFICHAIKASLGFRSFEGDKDERFKDLLQEVWQDRVKTSLFTNIRRLKKPNGDCWYNYENLEVRQTNIKLTIKRLKSLELPK